MGEGGAKIKFIYRFFLLKVTVVCGGSMTLGMPQKLSTLLPTLSQRINYSTWNSNLNPYLTWNSNLSLVFNLEFQFQWR